MAGRSEILQGFTFMSLPLITVHVRFQKRSRSKRIGTSGRSFLAAVASGDAEEVSKTMTARNVKVGISPEWK